MKHPPRRAYRYERQGHYGDLELTKDDNGNMLRVAQLRAVGSGVPSSLPTALLALSKKHTQEVRLDTCAQYSVAGSGLRRHGRCISLSAPVDAVEGFGGGQLRVLGVWEFRGTTKYQQTVTIHALVVDGQDDELLLGEDWMVEHQAKMDFGKRELKYLDAQGRKVIVPFTCYGVTSLLDATRRRAATVRMARTVKLPTNTRSTVQVKIDAEDNTTGIFIPKPSSKMHLLLAPTLSIVKNGLAKVAVLNIAGRREKLPARAALGTWVPTDETTEILLMNGELERERVASWVATLRSENTVPLTNEDSLDLGEMEDADRELVIALLRQYACIVEKKERCPPLSTTGVQHHINTGTAAPIMMGRRWHAVSENVIIDEEVQSMLNDGDSQ